MAVFDIKKITEEAEAEVNTEAAAAAKTKIKTSLRNLAHARKVVVNLEAEHQALLRDIGSE
jgi:hypothetical protein